MPLFKLLCCASPNQSDSNAGYAEIHRATNQVKFGKDGKNLSLPLKRSISISSEGSFLSSPIASSPQEVFPLNSRGFDLDTLYLEGLSKNPKLYKAQSYHLLDLEKWPDLQKALHRELLMQQQAFIPRLVLPAKTDQANSTSQQLLSWLSGGQFVKFIITSDGILSLTQAYTTGIIAATRSDSAIFSATSRSFVYDLPPHKASVTTHAYAAAGQPVIAAGRAWLKDNYLFVNNATGHYQCPVATLAISKIFWEQALASLNIPQLKNVQVITYDYLSRRQIGGVETDV